MQQEVILKKVFYQTVLELRIILILSETRFVFEENGLQWNQVEYIVWVDETMESFFMKPSATTASSTMVYKEKVKKNCWWEFLV